MKTTENPDHFKQAARAASADRSGQNMPTSKAVVKYDSRGGQFECWRLIVDGRDFGTGFSNMDKASDCADRINGKTI